MSLDLDAIASRWLRQCGPCDLGLPMSCTCPDGDPRSVISEMVIEIKRLRAVGWPEPADSRTTPDAVLNAALDNARADASRAWEHFDEIAEMLDRLRAKIRRRGAGDAT